MTRSDGGGIKAPFPWFGGKSRVSDLVWRRLGNVPNFVEPFAGSLACLLGRPHAPGIETVNDLDGYISNFWRAIAQSPNEVAKWAEWPVNECDLHARHLWLVARKNDLVSQLQGDPEYFDAKIAGWWVWGICSWIGAGWCSGAGPWVVSDGKMVDSRSSGKEDIGNGINRQLPYLGGAGCGINRKLPHLGDAGLGINRQHNIPEMFSELSERLLNVRVCCGDWSRVLGPSPTTKLGITGVFLDPPYADTAGRYSNIYVEDSLTVAHDVMEWAIEHGDDPLLRIALCGYDGEHIMPDSWDCVTWKATGGYASQGKSENINATRERIWFSPHCLPESFRQMKMFG